MSNPIRRVPFGILAALLSPVAALGQSHDNFPPELVRFAPLRPRPVFTGNPGQWDALLRERGWIIKDGDLWKLWYTGYRDKSSQRMLGYATSRDGLAWTRHPDNPIYRDHWVEDMMVVKDAGRYWMFAEGQDDVAQLLVSDDGVQWRRVGSLDIRKTNGAPVPPGPYGTPTAWKENGVWHLFYERNDLGVWLARSRDMTTWTNVRDEPVLTPGPGEYERDLIALNQIIKHRGRYYAYYHGSAKSGPKAKLWSTGIATSTDLIHWEKYAGNPLFPVEQNKSSGIVVPDGARFRLYTMHARVEVHESAPDPFARTNLVAWCIVPFDGKNRGPAERAAMVKRLGLSRVAYDWRENHVASFEEEILQYQRHGLEYLAFWDVHDRAFDLFAKHGLHPQIWRTAPSPAGAKHEDRVAAAVQQLLPLVQRAAKMRCQLGLYNHGGWGGEPDNLVAVCKALRDQHQADHVGIVYNLHHGHGHIADFANALAAMQPYLLCLNLNGMTTDGDKKGLKILPLGAGEHDLALLRIIRDAKYVGPIGIIGHTNDDVELRLQDNLDGLDWLLPQLDGKAPGPRPAYRTYRAK